MSTQAHRDGDPAWLLKDFVAGAHELSGRLAKRMGVNATDFRALDHLLQHGPTGPNELGRLLGLTSPAATALADRLERTGHVERVRDPDDRRRVALTPTQHARDEAWRVLGPIITEMFELVADLPAEERDVVARFLKGANETQRRHAD